MTDNVEPVIERIYQAQIRLKRMLPNEEHMTVQLTQKSYGQLKAEAEYLRTVSPVKAGRARVMGSNIKLGQTNKVFCNFRGILCEVPIMD